MNMQMTSFDPSAWFNIEPEYGTALDYGARDFYTLALAFQEIAGAWSYSVSAPEGLVASGGFLPIVPGVAEIWCATTKLARGRGTLPLFRIMRSTMDGAVDAFALRRIQATVAFDDANTAHLVEALGLTEETGPEGLKNFLPGGRAVRIYGRS